MKNKKIVFFCGTLMQGGAERVISVLANSLILKGFDVSILCYYCREIFYNVDSRVKILYVESETNTTSLFKNLLWIRKFFKSNPDVIISFLASFNVLALVAHIGLKQSIIVADRSTPQIVPKQKIIRMARNFLYRFADAVVLQTQRNYEYFSSAVQRRGCVIFNPIDASVDIGSALKADKKKKIVSVGRLIPSKNHKMLIDAFDNIKEKFPEYDLIIYGDGENRDMLEQHIKEKELSDKVFLPGNEKRIFEKIKDAELFVFSSDFEGMPNALMEAMCLGLPVISTNVSGVEDMIINKDNGLIIDCGNTEQLSLAMQEMLSNKDFRNKCANKAVELSEKVKTEEIVDKWISLINNVS